MDQVRKWLDGFACSRENQERLKKPLLVHGPCLSGKKTLLRQELERRGFHVIIPRNAKEWSGQHDQGLHGRHAFLINIPDVGLTRPPSQLTQAPVIYVTVNPYDHATKAELMAGWQLISLRTNRCFAVATEATRDAQLNFWEVVRQIHSPRLDLDDKLQIVRRVDDYVTTVINQSLTEIQCPVDRADLLAYWQLISRTLDWISWGDEVHWINSDLHLMFSVIAPLLTSHLQPNQLLLARPQMPRLKTLHDQFQREIQPHEFSALRDQIASSSDSKNDVTSKKKISSASRGRKKTTTLSRSPISKTPKKSSTSTRKKTTTASRGKQTTLINKKK